ncbi:hypothetical protein Bca4012_073148 [Brassica carinata]|uniref:BnaC05g29620D protein n=2 Tax=Brassica TaxID=3705 RepID=A0A078FBA5_BRANA|nr:BnaC05g29620D [Brassica napus]VDD45217.1 unnamed protein product [Brassica oleracea]
MDKTTLIELYYRRSRASSVGLDVVTREVSTRSVYIGSKDETFGELEPKLDPVTVGVSVETWVSPSRRLWRRTIS